MINVILSLKLISRSWGHVYLFIEVTMNKDFVNIELIKMQISSSRDCKNTMNSDTLGNRCKSVMVFKSFNLHVTLGNQPSLMLFNGSIYT